jgi:hexosaminidase
LSQYVLGTEAALWTPYMKNPQIVDYYMYPRFYAFAEVAWGTNKPERYQEFLANIGPHYKRLDYQSIHACRNYFDAYIDGAYNPRTPCFRNTA